jgi:hypothetical protein
MRSGAPHCPANKSHLVALGADLPWAGQPVQSVAMSEEAAEQRLRETIERALAAMLYRPPDTPDTSRDAFFDAAAGGLQATLQVAGWRIEPSAAAVVLMPNALRYGLMAYKLKPPDGSDPAVLADYHRAVTASLLGQLVRAGWTVEEPATLRKAPPREPHW